ncbi:MAG: MFS transporter [Anaerolineae bacterium]|nr:MFS transporter [Anaerolineae bacterium]
MRGPWRVLLPLTAAAALSLLGDSALYTILPSHTAAAGIALGSVGVILGANRLVRIFLNSPVGALYDRVGRRAPFIVAMGLGTASTALYALVRGFWPLLLARLVWGLAWALIMVGSYNILFDISTPTDRGRITGAYHSLAFLGSATSMLLSGLLNDWLGYHSTFLLCAVGTGLGMLIALLGLPETARSQTLRRQAVSEAPPRRGWNAHLLSVSYASFANTFAGNGVLMSTMGLLLSERFGDSVRVGALVLGVASLTGVFLSSRTLLCIVFNWLSGYSSDRLGRRGPVALLGLMTFLVGNLLLALGMDTRVMVLGFVLAAIGDGVVFTSLAALTGDLVTGERQGVAVGLFATAGDIGAAVGPVVGYLIAERWGLPWTYLVCALLIGSACLVLARSGVQRVRTIVDEELRC